MSDDYQIATKCPANNFEICKGFECAAYEKTVPWSRIFKCLKYNTTIQYTSKDESPPKSIPDLNDLKITVEHIVPRGSHCYYSIAHFHCGWLNDHILEGASCNLFQKLLILCAKRVRKCPQCLAATAKAHELV